MLPNQNFIKNTFNETFHRIFEYSHHFTYWSNLAKALSNVLTFLQDGLSIVTKLNVILSALVNNIHRKKLHIANLQSCLSNPGQNIWKEEKNLRKT